MKITLVLLAMALAACGSPLNSHEQILRNDLNKVVYEDGINLIEAKYIADAYLYLHGGKLGKAPYTKVSDGGNSWLGEVVVGVAVKPELANTAPVRVDKASGEVHWEEGPTVARVEL